MSNVVLENGEYLHPDFTINILEIAQPDVKNGLTKLGIGEAHFPIPTLDEKYVAAGWVGTKPNKFGELMVISYCASIDDAPLQDAAQWFLGTAEIGFFKEVKEQQLAPVDIGRRISDLVIPNVNTLQQLVARAQAIHGRLYAQEFSS
jgi:hypothetical protein